MTKPKSRRWTALVACATLLALARAAAAGPPLICHPFETGTAALLAWGDGPGWRTPDPTYDPGKLGQDLPRLLAADTPMLARMENLRRATVYVLRQPQLAADLLHTLVTRAAAQGPAGRLAWFDAAYLIESYRQAEQAGEGALLSVSRRPATPYRELNQLDGYAMLAALAAREGQSAEIEFARGLMARSNRIAKGHWDKARALAQPATALARNLAKFEY
jgi:hypothetical protein